jgi:hypothetical protein
MMDKERYSPQKIDIKRIQSGLSVHQMTKIEYECDLLRMDVQKLLYVAPFLFCEGITASNTEVVVTPQEENLEDASLKEEPTSNEEEGQPYIDSWLDF